MISMKYDKIEKKIAFFKSENRIKENLKQKICPIAFYTNWHILLLYAYFLWWKNKSEPINCIAD